MPVLSNLRKTELETGHWLNQPIVERQHLGEVQPQPTATLSTCLKPKKDLQHLTGLDNLNQLANRHRLQAYIDQDWQRGEHGEREAQAIASEANINEATLSCNGSNPRDILDKTLQQDAKRVEENQQFSPYNHQSTSVLKGRENKGETTKMELLKSYVAYYVSRGNRIISPVSGFLLFQKTVYRYWGYHEEFKEFWQQLSLRRDFCELYIEGDVYGFGQFLKDNCSVGECARCNLPIPMTQGQTYNLPNCSLCHPPKLSVPGCDHPESSNGEGTLGITHIVAIGTAPTDKESLEEWFSTNGFQVTFVCNSQDLKSQSLPSTVDLVLIYGLVSESEGEAWASELTCYPQFQRVPIVALSVEAGGGLPWLEGMLGLEDYLLSPQGGDRLVHHLRHLVKPRLRGNTPDLYWFPR